MRFAIMLAFTTLLTGTTVLAHGNKPHAQANPHVDPAVHAARLQTISAQYVQTIKPIFERTCFDCHTTVENLPWYHAVPGIRQLMDHHIEDAQKHMDMSQDFPFKSRKGPEHDLDELQEVLEKDEMPPWYYTGMQSKGRLTPEEKQRIMNWAKDGLKLLTTP